MKKKKIKTFINQNYNIIYQTLNTQLQIEQPELKIFDNQKSFAQYYQNTYHKKITNTAASYDTIENHILINEEKHRSYNSALISLYHELWHAYDMGPHKVRQYNQFPFPTDYYFQTKTFHIKVWNKYFCKNIIPLKDYLEYVYREDEIWDYAFMEACVHSEIHSICSEYIKKYFNIDTYQIYQEISTQLSF